MISARLTPIAVAVSMLATIPAQAAESGDSVALTLGEVVVSGSADGPLQARRVLSSVDILPEARIANQPVANNWQLFGQLPGVMLTQFGQGTTSGKFSMRGFNGEGEINAVKLLIDGVPSNSNDGNMPYIDLAPRLDIESIEVVRGTNDPRYGLHNIAGNANIITKSGGNYVQWRATLGSFQTRELQAAAGIEQGVLAQNYALAVNSSDGYRAHSGAENGAFSAKWFITPEGGDSRFGLILRHSTARADEAGYLTAAQRRADPDQSPAHNATDADRRLATQVALQAETALGSQLFWTGQVYLNNLDDRRFVTFSANVSQQERVVAETHSGASTTLTWRAGKTVLGDLSVMGGLDVERQDNRSTRYNTVSQVRQSQTRDQAFEFDTAGAFVQAVLKPLPGLSLTPAFRADRVDGTYTNRLNGKTYDINDYGTINQPKMSAVYALSDAYSVYGNWGRTFQVGVGTASYKVNQTADLSPSINEGWEAGLKFRPLAWLEGRLAAWRQTASNEARSKLNDPANDAENIGQTRRQGVDLQLNAQPTRQLGLWVGAALQRSKILQADAASAGTIGKEIDHVPHLLYNLGADYQASEAWRLSAWVNGQSGYYLERTNSTGKFGGYTLANVAAAYRLSPRINLEVQVRNLFDRYNEYAWWDGAQSLHAPGAPRSVYGTVAVKF
ncbi:MAG: TonB-dependent receptor [Rhodocyclaceae bacterium]|nr:MAG: TonB-dependent receptor [Rhodocyclaceae bacterium]